MASASGILDALGRGASAAGLLVPGRAGLIISAFGEAARLISDLVADGDRPDMAIIRIRKNRRAEIERRAFGRIRNKFPG